MDYVIILATILAIIKCVTNTKGKPYQSGAIKAYPIIEPKFTYGAFHPVELPYNGKPVFVNFYPNQRYPQPGDVPFGERRQERPIFPEFPAQRAPPIPAVNFTDEEELNREWINFKRTFNKTYVQHDEPRRKEIFIENRNKVVKFNQEYGLGLRNYVQKINGYADLLHHEFDLQLNGFNKTNIDGKVPERKSTTFLSTANVDRLPSYVDWREAGAVTPVKSQQNCGGCYAFASAGAIEGHHFRKTNVLVEFSPQNIIDCSTQYTNNGCAGGLMEYAFDYIRDNKGLDPEHVYPYEGNDSQQCRYKTDECAAQVSGYVLLDEGDEKSLEDAVATEGPVAVAIDARSDSFQFYSDGIYIEPQCGSAPGRLNHAVLVVGYGADPNGQQYWLIKNSYGPEWGIGGYMKMAKNMNNHCGIATYAIYPLV